MKWRLLICLGVIFGTVWYGLARSGRSRLLNISLFIFCFFLVLRLAVPAACPGVSSRSVWMASCAISQSQWIGLHPPLFSSWGRIRLFYKSSSVACFITLYLSLLYPCTFLSSFFMWCGSRHIMLHTDFHLDLWSLDIDMNGMQFEMTYKHRVSGNKVGVRGIEHLVEVACKWWSWVGSEMSIALHHINMWYTTVVKWLPE